MSHYTIVMNNSYYTCNIERTQELSDRIAERNIPSQPLAPQFSMRPVSTKYSILPIVDQREKSNVPITMRPTYNIKTTFNPGTSQAPWSGFAANINDESKLRNQFFALQKCQQSVYIPPSTSDMYTLAMPGVEAKEQQPFPGLFEEQRFNTFNPADCTPDCGNNLFNNCTRQQLLCSTKTS